jgi:hypothetical protein
VKYEAFHYTTATAAPIMYLAFVLVLARSWPDVFMKRRHWLAGIQNWILAGGGFVFIELVSLLVLSGAIRDTDGWRTLLVVYTTGFALLLTIEPLVRVVMTKRGWHKS